MAKSSCSLLTFIDIGGDDDDEDEYDEEID